MPAPKLAERGARRFTGANARMRLPPVFAHEAQIEAASLVLER